MVITQTPDKDVHMTKLLATLFGWLSSLFRALGGLQGGDAYTQPAGDSDQAVPASWNLRSELNPNPRDIYDPMPTRSSRSGETPRAKHMTQQPEAGASEYFPWPATRAPGGKGNLTGDVFKVKDGMLSDCGYQVGASGLPVDQRRRILDDVYQKPLPPQKNANYAAEWGVPHSAARLQKMAESIASFVRNAKRRNAAQMEKSIREWEADLAYLKRRYYDGYYSFRWPETDLDRRRRG
jgi:hypothetical protein